MSYRDQTTYVIYNMTTAFYKSSDEKTGIFLKHLVKICHKQIRVKITPVISHMRKSVSKFVRNAYLFFINFPELGQTNYNMFVYYNNYKDDNIAQHDDYMFPFFRKIFSSSMVLNRGYVNKVFDQNLFLIDRPYVDRDDFNTCLMYFVLHKRVSLSSFCVSTFIQNKFNPFDVVYDNIVLQLMLNDEIRPHSLTLHREDLFGNCYSTFDIDGVLLSKIHSNNDDIRCVMLCTILYDICMLPIYLWTTCDLQQIITNKQHIYDNGIKRLQFSQVDIILYPRMKQSYYFSVSAFYSL